MNRSTKLRSCFTLATMLAMACLFTGCIYPHTTERSQEVRGRLLDAQTRLPIKGAKIQLFQSPHHPTYSDAKGCFRLKATRNFHMGVDPAGGDQPSPKPTDMEISHEKYEARYGQWGGDIGDVLLKPKQSSTP